MFADDAKSFQVIHMEEDYEFYERWLLMFHPMECKDMTDGKNKLYSEYKLQDQVLEKS